MRNFLVFVLLFSVSTFASIGDKKLSGEYKDWLVYTALEDGEKVCYILSYPKKKSEQYTVNRHPYVMVSYVDKKADEVNVSSGFQYDKEPVILNIDKNKKYELSIIEGDRAWAEHIKTDQDLIFKMKQGLSMIVHGKIKATIVDDTYSLLGFQKAYQKMHDLCHKN